MMKTPAHRTWLWAICIAAFIIRLAFNLWYVGLDSDPTDARFQLSDAIKYQNHAIHLLEEGRLHRTAAVPPGYPVFLRLLYAGGVNVALVRIIQSLLSASVCLLIFYIARALYDEKTAYLASALSVLYPFFIFWSGMFVSEIPFLVVYLAALFFLIRATQLHHWYDYTLSAACLGIATLTRAIALPMLCFVALIVLITYWRNYKRLICSLALYGIVFSAVLTPWIARNYTLFHTFIPATTAGGLNFLNGMNSRIIEDPSLVNVVTYDTLPEYTEHLASLDEVTRNREATRMTLAYYKTLLQDNPRRLAIIIGKKFIEFWDIFPQHRGKTIQLISVLSYGLLLPFFIVGLILTLPHPARHCVSLCTIAHSLLLGLAFVPNIRYRFPIEPFYVIIASYGIVFLLQKLSAQRSIV